MLWGGNFQQILPVIEKGSRKDIVYTFIQHSYLYNHVQIFHLTQNMQLGQSPEDRSLHKWLLSVGEGSNQQHGGVDYSMSPPDHVKISGRAVEGGLESVHATYPDISDPQSRPSRYFTERTILTTHNGTVDGLSHSILAKSSGVTHTFAGYDKVVCETQER